MHGYDPAASRGLRRCASTIQCQKWLLIHGCACPLQLQMQEHDACKRERERDRMSKDR